MNSRRHRVQLCENRNYNYTTEDPKKTTGEEKNRSLIVFN